jgi:uncharacterized protein
LTAQRQLFAGVSLPQALIDMSMNKRDIINVLRRHDNDLRARGIIHAALFGSIARGENGPKSDIDILIELDPGMSLDIFAYAGLKRHVASLFRGRVDVVNKEALKPRLREPVSADAVYAFLGAERDPRRYPGIFIWRAPLRKG